MVSKLPDTDQLIERASRGDGGARQELLARHRSRLRRMVAVRLHPQLAARLDPSDVVQEALADAAGRLSDYLRRRPIPFYPWLRQFALERLWKLHRRHVRAQRRSVLREETPPPGLSDQSVRKLAGRLASSSTSPSRHFLRNELRERLKQALERLSVRDREVLVLRHLEQLSTDEVAAVLGISTAAVLARQTRALERLRNLLEGNRGEFLG